MCVCLFLCFFIFYFLWGAQRKRNRVRAGEGAGEARTVRLRAGVPHPVAYRSGRGGRSVLVWIHTGGEGAAVQASSRHGVLRGERVALTL